MSIESIETKKNESAEQAPEVTIGVELECILWDPVTKACVNVDDIFPGGLSTDNEFESVTRDAGVASLEFTTRICASPSNLSSALLDLRKKVQERAPHLVLKFQSLAPLDGQELAERPRYKAFFQALQQESPDGWEHAKEMPKWNSTQFHVGVDATTPQGLSILNILNDISPYASEVVAKKFGSQSDEWAHLGIFQKYADERRFSKTGRWIESPGALEEFYHGIPRLIKEDENGQIVSDLETPSQLGDKISEGTIWWFARPRKTLQTIEWRSFPSLEPSKVVHLAHDVHELILKLKELLPDDRVITPDEREAIYTQLAKSSYLVPEKPLSEEKWNMLAGRS